MSNPDITGFEPILFGALAGESRTKPKKGSPPPLLQIDRAKRDKELAALQVLVAGHVDPAGWWDDEDTDD